MLCYNHKTNQAVGLCCECHKGLCEKCCQEANGQLACCEKCAQSLKEKNEINERAKMIYGIGQYGGKRKVSLGALFLMTFGFLLSFTGIYDVIQYNKFVTSYQIFFLAMGVLFIIFGILHWIRAKKTGVGW